MTRKRRWGGSRRKEEAPSHSISNNNTEVQLSLELPDPAELARVSVDQLPLKCSSLLKDVPIEFLEPTQNGS